MANRHRTVVGMVLNHQSGLHEPDRAVEQGEDLGPLHGVPFANKDTYPVEGVRHTDGSLLFEDRIAEENEQARVQRFLDAGAILLGTVNTPSSATWARPETCSSDRLPSYYLYEIIFVI